jgi:hypothetical protein
VAGVLGGVTGGLLGGVEGGVTGGVDGDVVGGVTGGVPGGVSEADGDAEATGGEGNSSDANRTARGNSSDASGVVDGSSPATAGWGPKVSVARAISSSGNILAELAITALPRSSDFVALSRKYALGQRA